METSYIRLCKKQYCEKQVCSQIASFLLPYWFDITGWGLIIPVMPGLIEELTGGNVKPMLPAIVAGWIALLAVCAICLRPSLGGLSDKYGRRPVLHCFRCLAWVDYILLTFAPNITWLFIGRIIAGITGASITTASAYIADISTPATRAQNFGMIGAAFGIGFILGPMLGGLLGQLGSRVPFMVAAALCLLNWLYGYFVLPESLPPDKRRAFDIKRANPVGTLLQLRKYPVLLPLISCMIFLYLSGHAVQSNWAFFGIERFKWDERMIGISLGAVGLLVGLVQGGLVRVIPKLATKKCVSGYHGCTHWDCCCLPCKQTWMMFVFLIPYDWEVLPARPYRH